MNLDTWDRNDMAGLKGKSGPPGNMNTFRHGLAGISQRRVNGSLTPIEQSIREEILAGLLADKGGEVQISTAIKGMKFNCRTYGSLVSSLRSLRRFPGSLLSVLCYVLLRHFRQFYESLPLFFGKIIHVNFW